MILRDNPLFTVECDVDDDKARSAVDALVEVFREYSLDGNDTNEPIGIDIEGIQFVVRYKRFNA